ncbi:MULTISPECIES: hypothetical protein [Halolamina]|uniref:Uncharacterized protein n=1 Tax=Halolamina pelagica TaxID=699431 RepID=A0A1I5VSD2_9EURY|nr:MULTISPECIES: hypothetical protein [Halolamina]NHX37817.1 hypothetical protein [Halolamina sp. R1-12]SFQ09906.1 hypothetical protein SAMN05216277_11936 [Halolamina pelagica]
MVLESLQARLGIVGRQRKFVNLESARELEDISDPETVEDESSVSLREWADRHPAAAVVLGLGSLLAAGLMVRWGARFAIGALRSPWTYATVAALLILGWVYRYGWRRRDSQVTELDELQLKMGGSSKAYKGRHVELPGEANAFIPIKGWSGILSSPKPYRNGEIAAGLGISLDPRRADEDGAAVIRLEPGEYGSLVGVSDTEWGGTKIVQETNSITADPGGNYTSLRCTLPEFDDARVDGLRKQNEQMANDLSDAKEEINVLQRRLQNTRERMNKPIEESVNDRIETHERLSAASRGRPRQQQTSPEVGPKPRQDFQGNGSMSADTELQQVEEELKDDED